MTRERINSISTALFAGGTASFVFFIAANVNLAALLSWDLSFWGFALIFIAAGSAIVFGACFVIGLGSVWLISRLPTALPDKARALALALVVVVGIASLIAGCVSLIIAGENWFWGIGPSVVATAVAAGLAYLPGVRARWGARTLERRDQLSGPWIT